MTVSLHLPDTIPGLLRRVTEEVPGAVASFHRRPTGQWVPTRWTDLWQEVQRVALAFRGLGLGTGDRLAILARTCREWQLAELAGLQIGAAIVGIDAHASPEQVAWILEHSGSCGLLVDSRANLGKVPEALLEKLRFVIVLEPPDPDGRDGTYCWADLPLPPAGSPRLDDAPSADHAATLVYTSGTTGMPKGVEYSHGQLMLACQDILGLFPDLGESNRVLCWLPMSSMFQRLMNLSALASRTTTYFVEDPREIMERIAEVRPTVFTSVPRFYEKLHDGIQARLATHTGMRRWMIEAALAAGSERARRVRSGTPPDWRLRLRHGVLDRLVLRKIRGAMGGSVKWLISGSAPAPVWLLEFFHSIGLLVLEGYALTENAIPIAANVPEAYRFGSVGRPLSANTIALGEDGEVLVKGPTLFGGYYREERPPDRFTSDGFYRTGDLGRLDGDGFLYLTGRKSELIKTSTGRRISPALVESVYRRSRYIDEIVVVGNDRSHLAALIILNEPAVEDALARDGIPRAPGEPLAALPAVTDLVRRELDTHGQRLAVWERVRAFAILSEPFTMAGGELTATLKPRRERIVERRAAVIEALYRETASAASPSPARTSP